MRRLVLLLGAGLVLSACGGGDDSTASHPSPRPDAIHDLDNVLALRSDFEADAGKTRVIILLSPT